MTLTPDQLRKRENEIKRLAFDWEIHVPSKELRRIRKSGLADLIGRIWKRKYTMKILYIWTAEQFSRFQLMSENIPLEHDNIIKPKDVPYIFALKNGWTIPDKDLKTLTNGPLVSESGELLVKANGTLSYYWNKIWPIVVIVSILLSLVRSLTWLFG